MPTLEITAALEVTEGLTTTGTLQTIGTGGVVDPGVGEPGVFGAAWEVTATLEVDGSVLGIALPATGTVQEAGVEVYVDDVLVPLEQMCGPWKVTRSRRQAVQAASFAVRLAEWGQSPFGDPYALLGPPTGIKPVDFYGVYRSATTGTVYRFPLLLDGIVDNVTRDSGTGGHIESYEVLDAMARYSRVPITIIFATGHGLPRGRMTKKIYELAGETQFALEDGNRAYKEAQFVDSDAVADGQEVNDVEGRIVRRNRTGYLVNPKLYDPDKTAVQTIDEEDILATSSVRVTFPGDAITEVTATSTEQIHSDVADDACGAVTGAPVKVETYRVFAVPEERFWQNNDGSLTTLSSTTTSKSQIYAMTWTRKTTRCGVTVREESESWAYYNPAAARKYWSTGSSDWLPLNYGGTPPGNGVYIGADGTPGGDEDAFQKQRAFWTPIGRTAKNYYYDADGWVAPLNSYDSSNHLAGSGLQTGKYLGSLTYGYGWYNVRSAIKEQPLVALSFDELDPIPNVKRTGAGEAVSAAYETFQLTQVVVELVNSSNKFDGDGELIPNGYIESTETDTWAYAITPTGNAYQYSDGSLSGDATQQFVGVNSEVTVYTSLAENQHTETVITTKLGEAPETQSTTGLEGAPPAIDCLPGYEPYDPGTNLTTEEQAFAVDANPGETRPIKATVSAAELLLTHLPSTKKTSYPYAEDINELAAAATEVIRESLVIKVDLTLAANFPLAEGDAITLTHNPSGIVSRRCIVDSITWSGAPNQPTLTSLSLDLYTDG